MIVLWVMMTPMIQSTCTVRNKNNNKTFKKIYSQSQLLTLAPVCLSNLKPSKLCCNIKTCLNSITLDHFNGLCASLLPSLPPSQTSFSRSIFWDQFGKQFCFLSQTLIPQKCRWPQENFMSEYLVSEKRASHFEMGDGIRDMEAVCSSHRTGNVPSNVIFLQYFSMQQERKEANWKC